MIINFKKEKIKIIKKFSLNFFRLNNNLIIKNSYYNFLLQFSNYIIPLILIPYLTRTVGQEGFGKIAFAQSFVLIASIFTDFGFQLSASREISYFKDKLEIVSEITSNTLYTKILLLFLTIILTTPFLYILPIFSNNQEFYTVGLLLIFTKTFGLEWYFYGLENIKVYTFLQIIGKFFLIILVFSFVKRQEDAFLYLLFWGITSFIVNILNFFFIVKHINFTKFNLNRVFTHIKKSFNLFFFNISVNLYTNANTIIIGLLLPPAQVGLYSAGEKIIRSIIGLWQPLTTVLYPRINHLIFNNIDKAKKLFWISIIFYGLLGLILTLFVFVFSNYIVINFLGLNFKGSIIIIKILSPIILIVALSNVLGILFLLPLKLEKQFNLVLILTGTLNILISVPLIKFFNIKGMAYSFLMSEIIVLIGCIILFKKYNGRLYV